MFSAFKIEDHPIFGESLVDTWLDCCTLWRDRRSTKGNLSLTADFGASTIRGMIDELEYRTDSASSFAPLSSTQAIINNGAINGNQFTADLDVSGPDFSADGEMSGAFYGSSAEEVGGVIKTTSTTNSIGIGWFGGSRENDE